MMQINSKLYSSQQALHQQHVKGPTHRSGHTLDLIIGRQNDIALSFFTTLMCLLSAHQAVLCPMAFAKSPASKSQFKQRRIEDVDLDALKADILISSLGGKLQDGDPDSLVQLYNTKLCKIIHRHAPEESRSITLRPHVPWFHSEIRKLKLGKRRYKRAYRTSGPADQSKLFRVIDGMFKVKPVPVLLGHARVQEFIERFSRHFVDKIAKLWSIVSCPAQRSLQVTSSPSTIGISKSFRCCCAPNQTVSLHSLASPVQFSSGSKLTF